MIQVGGGVENDGSKPTLGMKGVGINVLFVGIGTMVTPHSNPKEAQGKTFQGESFLGKSTSSPPPS